MWSYCLRRFSLLCDRSSPNDPSYLSFREAESVGYFPRDVVKAVFSTTLPKLRFLPHQKWTAYRQPALIDGVLL
jgi:hypothetical protein